MRIPDGFVWLHQFEPKNIMQLPNFLAPTLLVKCDLKTNSFR